MASLPAEKSEYIDGMIKANNFTTLDSYHRAHAYGTVNFDKNSFKCNLSPRAVQTSYLNGSNVLY